MDEIRAREKSERDIRALKRDLPEENDEEEVEEASPPVVAALNPCLEARGAQGLNDERKLERRCGETPSRNRASPPRVLKKQRTSLL